MLKKLSVFVFVALIAWVSTSAQDGTELILEQGVNDYEGTRDTTIYDESSNSNGAGDHIFAGQTNRRAERRALLAFDLADVPEGATITAVSLSLTVSRIRPGSGSTTITLQRLTKDWGEGTADAGGQEGTGASTQDNGATWAENFRGESAWDTEGGDFVEDASAEGTAGANGSTLILEGDGLVADVQAWVDGKADNFGWVVIGDGTAKRFHSSNSGVDEGLKPRLVITFTN